MTWIEVHQSLPTHGKTIEAAAFLDVPEVAIVGHMVCLWLWAVDNGKDGIIPLDKPLVIAKAARWPGEPGRFLDALVAAGFLDSDGAIHDWDRYTGKLMEQRERRNEQTKERMRAYRERRRIAATEDQKDPAPAPASVTQSVTRNGYARYAPVTHLPDQPDRTGPTITPTSSEGGPTLDSGPISRPRTRKGPEAESLTAKTANRGRTLTPLQEVVEAYLTAVGRNAARVQNWGRYGAALCELQGVPPAEVAHCTAWLASDPYYRDQARPPPPEQVAERYPGWVALGRPARWKPPPKRNGRVTMADTVAAINNGTLDLNQPLAERSTANGHAQPADARWIDAGPLERGIDAVVRRLSAP